MARPKTSIVWRISKEELVNLVNQSKSIGEVLAFFNMKNHGSNYLTIKRRLDHDQIDFSKFKGQFGKGRISPHVPLNQVLVENSTFSRTALKKRLLSAGILKNECSECGLTDLWNGKKLTMVLDHRNGINNDNRRENLRMLCPNCNSQQPTFAGRNNKKT